MPPGKRNQADIPVELSARLTEALVRERVVPRFVDGYVEEHQRYGLQVHAALYKDLIGLLQREALVAMTVRAFEVAVDPPDQNPRSKNKLKPLPKKDVAAFRRNFFTALTRQQKWGINEALDFPARFANVRSPHRTNRRNTSAQTVRNRESPVRRSLRLPARLFFHGKSAHGSKSRAYRSGKSQRKGDDGSPARPATAKIARRHPPTLPIEKLWLQQFLPAERQVEAPHADRKEAEHEQQIVSCVPIREIERVRHVEQHIR